VEQAVTRFGSCFFEYGSFGHYPIVFGTESNLELPRLDCFISLYMKSTLHSDVSCHGSSIESQQTPIFPLWAACGLYIMCGDPTSPPPTSHDFKNSLTHPRQVPSNVNNNPLSLKKES
jgi:hypothetical protein